MQWRRMGKASSEQRVHTRWPMIADGRHVPPGCPAGASRRHQRESHRISHARSHEAPSHVRPYYRMLDHGGGSIISSFIKMWGVGNGGWLFRQWCAKLEYVA